MNAPELEKAAQVYEAGVQAAQAGVEFWRNPYAHPQGIKNDYLMWSAGWCYGKQQEADQ